MQLNDAFEIIVILCYFFILLQRDYSDHAIGPYRISYRVYRQQQQFVVVLLKKAVISAYMVSWLLSTGIIL